MNLGVVFIGAIVFIALQIYLLVKGLFFMPGIVSLISICIFMYETIKQKNKNKIRNPEYSTYEYWRDAKFEHIEPIYAGYLINKNKININSVIATLFWLEEKEILNVEIINKGYYISLKKGITEEEIKKLKSYEQTIIELFFDKQKKDNKINLSERFEYFDKEYDCKVMFENVYNEIKQDVDRQFYSHNFDYEKNKWITLCVFNMVYGLLFVLMTTSTIWFWFNLIFFIIGWVSYFVMLKSSDYIKKEYLEEVNRLGGLYNYLTKFSKMKDKELKYVEIYEKFFIYAISFGITDKVETEFNQKAINNILKTNFQLLIDKKNKTNFSQLFQNVDLIFASLFLFFSSGFLIPIIMLIPEFVSGNMDFEGRILVISVTFVLCAVFVIFMIVLVKKIRKKNVEQFKSKINKK